MNPLAASALVACGGALGALSRFWVDVFLNKWAGAHLPFATFTSNVTGSFLIGLVAILIGTHAELTAFVMVGVLGGFTTFSTFSLETVRLFEAGRRHAGPNRPTGQRQAENIDQRREDRREQQDNRQKARRPHGVTSPPQTQPQVFSVD